MNNKKYRSNPAGSCTLKAAKSGVIDQMNCGFDKRYQVSGYGVNQRGLTVGCSYTIHAKDIISAKADAINDAKAGGLNHVTITRIQEVAA